MIAAAGLGHVLRVTNLIRKAHCALAKARWESGKRVDVRAHAAGAARRGLPFLLVEGHRLELLDVVARLRPVLLMKGVLRETRAEAAWRRRQRRRAEQAEEGAQEGEGEQGGGAGGGDEWDEDEWDELEGEEDEEDEDWEEEDYDDDDTARR